LDFCNLMNRFSTHVLDTALGLPAAGMPVVLEFADSDCHWRTIAAETTDSDGRCPNLLPPGGPLTPGQYRIRFETGTYHAAKSVKGLYPEVEITVTVRPGDTHLHVPLLLSPNGYTTYRGS
jgi:5-hydroxyisourate hydrolase